MKHSGLQKQVLQLYKQCLQTIKTKPIHVQPQFTKYVKSEFDKNKGMGKREVFTIEYLLRRGQRQLKVMENSQVVDIQI
jgi:succinate dehydrogenase assembly factor 1